MRAQEDVEQLPRVLHFERIQLSQVDVLGDPACEVLERLADSPAAQRLVRAAQSVHSTQMLSIVLQI